MKELSQERPLQRGINVELSIREKGD